jgi:F-type H+-transporting ATPase subunit alpha
VGGSAQTKIMKKVAGSAKLDLAQFYELAAFTQFASELDDSTKKQLTRGERVVEAMKQKLNAPYMLWQEVVILRAATTGALDIVEAPKVQTLIQALLEEIAGNRKELVAKIMAEKALSDDIASQLDIAIKEGVALLNS